MKINKLLAGMAALVLTSCSVNDFMPESPEEKLVSAINSAADETAADSSSLALPEEKYDFFPVEPKSAEYFLSGSSDEIKELYSRIYSGVFNHDTSIDIPSGVLDHEGFFELVSMVKMTVTWSDSMNSQYQTRLGSDETVISLEATYKDSFEDETAHFNELAARASEIAEAAIQLGSDYDKLCYIHDAIILGCEYDLTAPNAHCAYGALVDGRAVCEGYAKAFSLLCDMCGIVCLPVEGDAKSDVFGSGGHMWNKVQLDGVWYNVDVTWDDPTGTDDPMNVGHSYLLVSDEFISASHTQKSNRFMPEPAAEDSFGSWYYREGRVITADTDIYRLLSGYISDSMRDSDAELDVYCEDSSIYEHVCNEWFGEGSGSVKNLLTSYASPGESFSYSYVNNPDTRVIELKIL